MSRPTIAEKCERHGITKSVWHAAKQDGVNVWNDAELKAWLETRRPRTSKNARLPDRPAGSELPTVEGLEEALKRAESYEEVKIYKEKLAGLKIALAVRAEARELVSAAEVRESIARVVSAARGEILKLSNDLPPRLEGLTAGPMQAIIRDAIHEILTRLSDDSSALYQ